MGLSGISWGALAGETIDIETRWKGKKWKLEADLYLPEDKKGPFPTVIMIHGSAGPDSRYGFHRPALLKEGIAVLQVDFKSGIFKGPSDRPNVSNFIPFVFATLDELRKHRSVDPEKVGIMGFSFGGFLSLQSSWKDTQEMEMDADTGFVAHVAFYPGCFYLKQAWFSAFNKELAAPLLIFAGDKDSYGDGEHCAPFVQEMLETNPPDRVRVKIYPGTYHGFDGKRSWTGKDPGAVFNNKKAVLKPNPEAAKDAQALTIKFFKQAFGI